MAKRKLDDTVFMFTDGAQSGKTGAGGAATLLEHHGHKLVIAAADSATTNNRMEVEAILNGLEALTQPSRVDITSDSKYALSGIHNLPAWVSNGWCRADGQAVANPDLWERMQTQLAQHTVVLHLVKGHNGHHENEICDVIASRMAGTLKKIN